MKSREWLIEQKLAKPGSRGRLSKEAQAALAKAITEGMQFSDLTEKTTQKIKAVKPVRENRQTATPVTKQAKVREQRTIWGIDRGRNAGQMDLLVAFTSCDGCGKAIQYCKHDMPQLPNWIKSETYLAKPEI